MSQLKTIPAPYGKDVVDDDGNRTMDVFESVRPAGQRTPASLSSRRIAASSAVVCPTQVRCATGSMPVSRAIRSVIATVRSRVVPPAP